MRVRLAALQQSGRLLLEVLVHRRAKATVQWTLDRLRADFFPQDPEVLTDVAVRWTRLEVLRRWLGRRDGLQPRTDPVLRGREPRCPINRVCRTLAGANGRRWGRRSRAGD